MELTKERIDEYFQSNWSEIQEIVRSNSPKCSTKNAINITSDIYLICLDKSEHIDNLGGFIRICARNIYKWERSSFNVENRILAHNEIIDSTYEGEVHDEELTQERLYQLEMYRKNAEAHELIFFDMYVNRGIRSVRKISKALGVTSHGARVIVNEFKNKIKSYERKE